MRKVITMTAYRRPDYTRQVIEALARCEGISEWVFMPNVEPGHDSVIEQFRKFDACETKLIVNSHKFGLNRNTYQCVTRANETKAECIVHLEDDTVPSPDALRFFEWAIQQIESCEKPVVLVNGFHHPKTPPTDPSKLYQSRLHRLWTQPNGWATSRKKLRWLITQWCFAHTHYRSGLQKHRQTKWQIMPLLSRVQSLKHATQWTANCSAGDYSLISPV